MYRVEDVWRIQAVCSMDGVMVTDRFPSAAVGALL